jgi:hypothetical protein
VPATVAELLRWAGNGPELVSDLVNLVQTRAAGSSGLSVQPLMHDQPQPTCNRPQNDGGERGYGEYHGGPCQTFPEPPLGGSAILVVI